MINERIIQEKDNSKTKFLPDEELKETERGLGLIDPEQISGGLFLQIKGFPATLHSTTEQKQDLVLTKNTRVCEIT